MIVTFYVMVKSIIVRVIAGVCKMERLYCICCLIIITIIHYFLNAYMWVMIEVPHFCQRHYISFLQKFDIATNVRVIWQCYKTYHLLLWSFETSYFQLVYSWAIVEYSKLSFYKYFLFLLLPSPVMYNSITPCWSFHWTDFSLIKKCETSLLMFKLQLKFPSCTAHWGSPEPPWLVNTLHRANPNWDVL